MAAEYSNPVPDPRAVLPPCPGAAGSTGRGEANIKACGAFFAVEQMRLGASPQEACLRALERVLATTEDRLLTERGRPRFSLSYYALAKDGRFGGATFYEYAPEESPRGTYAVADAKGARLEPMAFLFTKEERPK